MRSLSLSASQLVVKYAGYHRDRRNIAAHLLGIPLIVTGLALWLVFPLGRWGLYGITAAWLAWAVTGFWYLTRGAALLGVATTVVVGLLVALAHGLAPMALAWGMPSWLLALGLFVLGWGLQFLGHALEGRKPAFADDIVGLLVGPMFVVAEVLMALGWLTELRQTVELQAGPSR